MLTPQVCTAGCCYWSCPRPKKNNFFCAAIFDHFWATIANFENNLLMLLFFKEYLCNRSVWLVTFENGINKTFKNITVEKMQKKLPKKEELLNRPCNFDFIHDPELHCEMQYILFVAKDWNPNSLGSRSNYIPSRPNGRKG